MRKRLKLSFDQLQESLTLIPPLEASFVLGGNGDGSALDPNASFAETISHFSSMGFSFAQDEHGNYIFMGDGTSQGGGILLDEVVVNGVRYTPNDDNGSENPYTSGIQNMLNRFLDEREQGSETGVDGSDGSDGSSTGTIVDPYGAGGGTGDTPPSSSNGQQEGYWVFEGNQWTWKGSGTPDPNAMHYGGNIEEVIVQPPSLNDMQWQRLKHLMNVSETVGNMTFDLPIADNNFEAVALYYLGIGNPVTIGPKSMTQLLSSQEFYNLHLQTSQEGVSFTNKGINFTDTVFHIGRTTVSAYVANGNVTYVLFNGDGFWDPNFWAENEGYAEPDGSDPNLELGGIPYDYRVAIFSLPTIN